MPTYRIYSVTSDGHIGGPAAVVTCENDQEAISRAQQLKNGHDVELWESFDLPTVLSLSDEPHPATGNHRTEAGSACSSRMLEGVGSRKERDIPWPKWKE